jgi:conjugative relaxase-like TrwC/TraI family protein
MLSIGRLGATGGADYYLDKVANSVDDYYLGRGEAPGEWCGAAAKQLGLVGRVDAGELRNLLAGLSASGDDLGARLSEGRRPGYDLTFSAPKGISLLWALGAEQVRDQISVAHDRAIGAVLDHLSDEACFVRRGAGGHQLLEAHGFIGAAFRHRTSRAGDPQLHTHVVVPNLVQGEDGKWSAPDGRHLYTWKKTAGTLYQSALRAELAPRGLAWQVGQNGLGELADIPKTILRAFSKRRVDIEAAMGERGVVSSRAAEVVALATRARKPDAAGRGDVLLEGWLEQLSAIELPDGEGGSRPATVDDVIVALGKSMLIPPGVEETGAVLGLLAGEKGISLDDWEIDDTVTASSTSGPHSRALPVTLLGSTFTRRDALGAVARAFDVTPAQAVALTRTFLDRDDVVRVLADPDAPASPTGTEHVRTKGGQLVPLTSGDRRFTTTELLAAEERIVHSAVERLAEGTAVVRPALVDQVLSLHSHLDGEQAAGVQKLLTSGHGYDLVVGQAGTGKSTMLRAARIGWEEAGFRVIGTAVAARTAADLESGTGIPSSSLTHLLADLRETGGLTSHHVIVVDEASMVGSRSLDQLRRHADGSGAKVVLVGDNRQLSSIDAGGALRTLANELGADVVTLTVNRRQVGADQDWEREALSSLRAGDVVPAIDAYVDHGRVTITGTIDQARQRLVEDWWAVHHDHTTAILAVRRVDVRALNEMVRQRRQAGGELGSEIRLGDKVFSIGDRVLFEQNQRVRAPGSESGRFTIKIRNGTFATVVGIVDPVSTVSALPTSAHTSAHTSEPRPVTKDGDVRPLDGDVATTTGREQRTGSSTGRKTELVVELDDGRRVVLPQSYVESSTTLGYALTVFRSQGITVDHTFGLGGDSLFQEAGYTQLSRGRLSNHLYVTAPENPRWEVGHRGDGTDRREALDSLVDALGRSREQTMAIDRLPETSVLAPDDLAAIYHQHAVLGDWLNDQAPVDVTDQLARALERDQRARDSGRGREGARQELATMATAQRLRNQWVVQHQEEITCWSQMEGTIRRYQYRLGRAATYTSPRHLTDLLGPLPERLAATERWQTAGGAVEAYRTRWNITDTASMGPEPTDPEQRDHWRTAVATVGAAGFLTDQGSPEVGSERGSLATQWEAMRVADRSREADRSWADGSVEPLPERHVPKRQDRGFDRDHDSGFGL